MGVSAARVPRGVLAWLGIAAMLFASAGSLVSGHAAIDVACAAALVEHDHSAHRIGAEPDAAPEHCDACHLTRTVRGTLASHQPSSAAVEPVAAARIAHEPASRVDLLIDVNRGPPAS